MSNNTINESDLWHGSIKQLLTAIAAKNLEFSQREVAADRFFAYVQQHCRDLVSTQVPKFLNDVIQQIFQLVNSTASTDRIAGVLAIDRLIDIQYDGNVSGKVQRLANYLRKVLHAHDPAVTEMAAVALGRLTRTEGSLTAEFVELEVKRAIEWLENESGDNQTRTTAALVLRELFQNSPTLCYVYVPTFLSVMWVALTSRDLDTRTAAAGALRAGLDLIEGRDTPMVVRHYNVIMAESKKGLTNLRGDVEVAHGSLLALRELLYRPPDYFRRNYGELVELVLRYKSHKDKIIRHCVIQLVPLLADLSPDNFVNHHVRDLMNFLLEALKHDHERSFALLALGQTVKAISGYVYKIGPYVESVITAVKNALLPRKGQQVPEEVFDCIGMLASSVGCTLATQMRELLPQMFQAGLSESLRDALSILAERIPTLLPDIQERLLNAISVTLTGRLFNAQMDLGINSSGSSSSGSSGSSTEKSKISLSSSGGSSGSSASKPMAAAMSTVTSLGRGRQNRMRKSGTFSGWQNSNPQNLVSNRDLYPLALRVLGSFDFEAHKLGLFVHSVLLGLLDDDSISIRLEAALTAIKLTVHPGEVAPTTGKYGALVADIVEKLLIMGITDPESQIRSAVLSALDSRYDTHLAQAACLRSLFVALNDEDFRTREIAITIIGRLAIRNPAYVMPSLRKTVVQLLTELEFSGDTRNKEECASLLGRLVRSSGHIMRPYVATILKALLPKLEDPSSRVASCSLAALGELSAVADTEMHEHTDKLLPLIIGALQDQSNTSKRQVALETLYQLSSNLGYVIVPYKRYPNLMEILLSSIKTEQNREIRQKLVQVLGVLGALDPHKAAGRLLGHRTSESIETDRDDDLDEDLVYPSAAINGLIPILRDSSLKAHHPRVIQAVMSICKQLEARCSPFLPRIMPVFLQVMRDSDSSIRTFLFQQVASLVPIVKEEMRAFLPGVFALVRRFWEEGLHVQTLDLLEKIAISLGVEIKVYLPDLMPLLLGVLTSERSTKRLRVLTTLEVLAPFLTDYLHLIVPAVTKIFQRVEIREVGGTELKVKLAALTTLGHLCTELDFGDYAGRITLPLLRVLDSDVSELQEAALETLCVLVYTLGSEFAIFIPMVNKVLTRNRIEHRRYLQLVSSLLKNETMELPADMVDANGRLRNTTMRSSATAKRSATMVPGDGSVRPVRNQLKIQVPLLLKSCEASHGSTKEDWVEWMRRFSGQLLRESPSPELRQCQALAQSYYPLARRLFHTAFESCWTQLDDTARDTIVTNLKMALLSPTIPPEILQSLLNLAEFMEHNMNGLPISSEILGKMAEQCQAYAKALHYKEIEFRRDPINTVQALISVNNQLGQPEAATGILCYAQEHLDIDFKESWYEKLRRWDEALAGYRARAAEDPNNAEYTMGRLRCLRALGEWQQLYLDCGNVFQSAEPVLKKDVAPLAAAAVWHLGKLGALPEYIELINENTYQGHFFRALLSVHKDRLPLAQRHIDRARRLVDTELSALVGESYERAYSSLCRAQHLSELEEIIEYKQVGDVRRNAIRTMWARRLHGQQRNVDVWQQVLALRSLVLTPKESADVWLRFAHICRDAGRLRTSHHVLVDMLGGDPTQNVQVLRSCGEPQIVYHYLKHLWTAGNRTSALTQLRTFTEGLSSDTQRLAARAHHRIGQWLLELDNTEQQQAKLSSVAPRNLKSILEEFRKATELQPNWYKTWHAYALTNFEAVSAFHRAGQTVAAQPYLLPAIQGFFRSIALGPKQSLQDTLRLLTLWFQHGSERAVEQALRAGFTDLSVDTWLQVIPQIIARIHSSSLPVRRLVTELLSTVGSAHPQALVYPLVVAAKSESSAGVGNELLSRLREHSPRLIEQTLLVADELIRVSIIWHEQWHGALEEASRAYFTEKNVEGMLSRLVPLYQETLARGPATLREVEFVQAHGRDLEEAFEWCEKFATTRDPADINQAWDLFYQVFRTINSQLPNLTKLDLQYVSPALQTARDLELAVPGTYTANSSNLVRIRRFDPLLSIIKSKQRPRKLSMFGDDGTAYVFLLKGHEDLRQDERVMQLFGLVNTLLAQDHETVRLPPIVRYAAIPLSPNSGVISWVPNCHTLNELVRKFRDQRKIELRSEHRRLLQLASNSAAYDALPLINKVELFQAACAASDGNDLAHILWQRSPNSEVWLKRRTSYTRSLSVMSMVGYILGLGDRHPSNIMLERTHGKIFHIDFGDCFEVAMQRDKYPEQVPFRLTRMLINAMEVSGIEGNYRSTCEAVMRVLRQNRQSLMAVLEAFVYDPLVNWRLLAANDHSPEQLAGEENVVAESADDGSDVPSSLGGISTPTDASSLSDNSPVSQSLMGRGAAMSVSSASSAATPGGDGSEDLNERALQVIARVSSKLTGQDFVKDEVLTVDAQVHKLITQATA
eukprot:CAMPEP_0174239676 /NCGR_PEP_ID=MMETSP0417-20130205/15613_1 /TAXON_ID=242541 /ORGANISM="Mayorella sp, Strain BSH-02190019" /LENGTH=2416 /DNA_ID=CAMNT_0015318639 /DNA_START=113 /DNA_END=7359 /DNA_ORIENTATION=+